MPVLHVLAGEKKSTGVTRPSFAHRLGRSGDETREPPEVVVFKTMVTAKIICVGGATFVSNFRRLWILNLLSWEEELF